MRIIQWVRREHSGLFHQSMELAIYSEKAGHEVTIRQPSDGMALYGSIESPDVHSIHSQLQPKYYQDKVPKFMWMHGEPLSSVGNGVSMSAIVDLASHCDAFICMRKAEHAIWSTIRRTYYVPKGVDLERFHPLQPDELGKDGKLSGEPAVLYIENWRGNRNPLYLCVAMQKVWEKYPNARLHLYNIPTADGGRMLKTFKALYKHNGWGNFLRSLNGPVPHDQMNQMYNRADIVVSCLYPLYARGIEAFGAGKAFISPGYSEYTDYPFNMTGPDPLHPDAFSDAILRCWENYDSVDYRQWAETNHDIRTTVDETIKVYQRYL